MNSHELYDKILRELPKDGRFSSHGDYHHVDLLYLSSCDYIDAKLTETGEVYLIKITPKGLKFISEGGFTEQDKIIDQAKADAELQRQNWITTTKAAEEAKKYSIYSLIIAVLSLIVAAIALLR